MQFSKAARRVCFVLGAIVIAGIGTWFYQLYTGLGLTGMSNGTSWGLYIAAFTFFEGLASGSMLVASSAYVFKIEKFKRVALPAALCSFVSICLAGLLVLIDLGGIQRVWRMFVSPNMDSPLMWDVLGVSAFVVIALLFVYFLANNNERKAYVTAWFALPATVLIPSITAWIFGLQNAKEGWYSAIMAPVFVGSSFDSGIALLLVCLIVLELTGAFYTGKYLLATLSALMATCMTIDAYFIGCELLTDGYIAGSEGSEFLNQLFFGASAPFFWFEMIFGLLIPFVIMVFAKNRRNTKLVMVSSLLVLAGVFCKRLWVVLTAFVNFNVYGALGVTSGSTYARSETGILNWATSSSYVATVPEIFITVAVASLGALMLVILFNWLVKGTNFLPEDELSICD